MGFLSSFLWFGLGAGATYIIVPEIRDAVHQIRTDTEAILNSKHAIEQLCVDKIARWYYDGTLEVALDNIIRQANENRFHTAELQSLLSLNSGILK
jgi:hypothetical protein